MHLKNLTIKHHQENIINSLDLTIHPGEIFVLMGPSGSGKSTLLKGIAGLLPMATGIKTWETGVGTVGLVFQESRLFPHLTVLENMAFGLRVKRMPVKERKARVREFLSILQLEDLENRYPHQLSGGQQQRVSLGRSLILNPDLLLLDEPFASLDTALRLDLIEWLFKLQKDRGFSILWVTHYIDEAFSVADRIGILMGGTLQQVARPADLFQHPASEKIASFLSLPNRFSRNQWQKWFRYDLKMQQTNEIGWVPANQIQIMDGSNLVPANDLVAYISGIIVKRIPGKEGYSILVQSEEATFEINTVGWESTPKLKEKIQIMIPYDQIFWYTK